MKVKEKIILLAIVIIAIFFRFNNLNWDENQHLHPDERFLTMVGNDMKIPASFSDYLNPNVSTMNPSNINYKFFVYGVFPVSLNKILAVLFNNDNYNAFTLQGRFLSALFDLFIIILVYKTAKLLISSRHPEFISGSDSKKQMLNQVQHDRISNVPLWTAFFYAAAVLPIQLSHFFAVDTFLNFFMFASFYYALKFKVETLHEASLRNIILSAIFFGLALATKITAIFILPLNLFFILITSLRGSADSTLTKQSQLKRLPRSHSSLAMTITYMLLYLLISYFTLRLANPYYFQNSNFFNPQPNKIYIENLQELRSLGKIDPTNFYPPMIQWLNKNTVKHSLINNAIFGLGTLYFILVIIGMFAIIFNFPALPAGRQFLIFKIILIWVISIFSYQSLQTTPTLRYFIIIYPFLAIFTGIGIVVILNLFQDLLSKNQMLKPVRQAQGKLVQHDNKLFFNVSRFMFHVLFIPVLLVWPLMFSSIYRNKHSRVVASEWIYKNFKNGAVIANEHWDDGLPLPVVNNYNKQFIMLELPVFGPDDETKWSQMNEILDKADYYILSSNRGWGSIPTVPEKYPRMTKFYKDLFDPSCHPERSEGSPCYQKIAEFTSYPKLCLVFSDWCLVLNDDWADESFSVYDHPKVLIYKKLFLN